MRFTRHAGDPVRRLAVGHLLAVRSGGIEDHQRRDALLGQLLAGRRFALREERHRLVPMLMLGDRYRLQDIAPDHIAHEHEADIRAIHRVGLGQKSVEQIRVLRRLHLDFEAEVLRRLLGNGWNGCDGRARMPENDIFDVLRPDRGEAGYGRGATGQSGGCGATLQNGASRNAGHHTTSWQSADQPLLVVS